MRCGCSPAGACLTARSCSAAAASSRPGGAEAARRARRVVAVTARSQSDGVGLLGCGGGWAGGGREAGAGRASARGRRTLSTRRARVRGSLCWA